MTDALEKKLSAGKTIDKKVRSPTPAVRADAIRKALQADEEAVVASDDGHDSAGDAGGVGETASDVDADEMYQVEHPTGDSRRDKVRKLLSEALHKEDEAFVTKAEADLVAYAIEAQMVVKFEGSGPGYRSKYRDLSFNFKDIKNGNLRQRVLTRQIRLARLLEMSHDDLANEDLKKTRVEVHERMTRDAQPFNKQEASTDQFRCGRCKQRKCNYYQMQTRSADEPLTTFVTCVNCNNRWKF